MGEKEKQKNEEKKDKKNTAELEKKVSELEALLEKKQNECDELNKKIANYLNTAAYYKAQAEETKKDFERFKERNKNIETEAKTSSTEWVVKKLLPVIDNFDQAIAHVTDAEIIKGFSMIYSSLLAVLDELGIVEIKSKNEELNPEFHNCISTEETDDKNLAEKIASIYQKGYMFAESKKVVRPATVSVYKLN